jgi:hypothetical protein
LAPTVGIAATGFYHPGGILQPFRRQDQQILRLPTAARSLLARLSASTPSTSSSYIMNKIKVSDETDLSNHYVRRQQKEISSKIDIVYTATIHGAKRENSSRKSSINHRSQVS